MFVTYYRIHFINGQAMNVAECTEDENAGFSLISRFQDALPDGLLILGTEDMPQQIIPANNILYITVEPDDEE